MSNELTQVIDRLVEQKTFGLDALGAIKELRDKAAEQERQLKSKDDEISHIRAKNVEHTGRIEAMKVQIEQLLKQQAEVLDREKAADKAIYDAEKHQAVADAWRAAMGMVFKPVEVRTSIQRQVALPASGLNTYPITMPETETTTVTQE